MSATNENDPLTGSALCTGDPLAQALSVLEPMPTAMNRDQLMFAAGSAARDRALMFWKRIVYGQSVAACLVVGIGIAISDFSPNTRSGSFGTATHLPAPAPAKQPMAPAATPKSAPAPVSSASAFDEADDITAVAKYLKLRSNVLSLGVNALPNPIAPPPQVDVGQLEDSLQLPRGTFAIHGMPTKKPQPEHDE